MATRQVKSQETNRVLQVSHKVALAYVGAFGVVGDEASKLFTRFVARGEQMEKDARQLVKRNDKQAREFAEQVSKEQKTAAAQAKKTVKKAVKQVEHAIA